MIITTAEIVEETSSEAATNVATTLGGDETGSAEISDSTDGLVVNTTVPQKLKTESNDYEFEGLIPAEIQEPTAVEAETGSGLDDPEFSTDDEDMLA